MEDFETQVEYYNALAKSEENRGHYKKATYWFKKQSQLQDSIVEKIYQNKFKNIEIENEFLLQQQKNKFQKEIISNQKAKAKLYFLIIVLLGILVITLFMLWYFAIRHHFKRLKIEVQKRKIHQIEEENKRKVEALETQQIQAELKSKKRELLISLLFVKKRKEKVKQIYEEIEKVADRSIISKESVLQIKDFVKLKSDELDQAEDVQHKLVNTHKDFFNKLLKDFPELSKTELKILAYLSIGLSTKEIADVQYVSIEAIRKSRYRIRKKLNLEAKDSLENFILQYH
ncbi:MAG TPA: hypothetical protein ENK75_01735 [Saprospiraceae bacterium]|nr:hypothetical protein [Saprospiraceae bacterium]